MKKIILLSKVAALAKDIESNYMLESGMANRYTSRAFSDKVAPLLLSGSSYDDEDGDDGSSLERSAFTQTPYVIDPEEKDKLTGALTDAQKTKITKLLGTWEEPEKAMGVEVGYLVAHLPFCTQCLFQ